MGDPKDILSLTLQDGIVIARFTRTQIYDIETAELLDHEFKRAIEGKANVRWIVDFSGLELIISRVINCLLLALRMIRASGGEVYLCGMGETVGRVIRLAKLDRVFKTYDSLDQALAAAKGA